MKIYLSIIALVLIPVLGTAQSLNWWTSLRLIDSLTYDVAIRTGRSEMRGSISREPYKPIRDSILRVLVQEYVRKEAKAGRYIWPWHQYQTAGRNGIPEITRTWAYIISTFYDIRPSGFHMGCFGVEGMEIHDSFMKVAIEEAYGAYLFPNTQKTADSLDKIGLGLNLPYIAYADSTIDWQQYTRDYLDSVTFKEREKDAFEEWILVMEFVDGKLKYLVPVYSWEYKKIHSSRSLRRRAKRYIQQARSMPWVGPKYAGKSIAATVAYDFREREMWFLSY